MFDKKNLVDSIKTRRSVRSYIDKKVDKEIIEDIVEAALSSPSSKNSQPWYLIILSDGKKDEIADMMLTSESKEKNVPINIENPELSKDINDSTIFSAKTIKSASHLVLLFNRAPFSVSSKTLIKNINSSNLFTYNTEVLGIGACMQNILLSAHMYGLGALAICDIANIRHKLKNHFGFDYDFMVGIAIGYTEEQPRYRPNIAIDKILKYIN